LIKTATKKNDTFTDNADESVIFFLGKMLWRQIGKNKKKVSCKFFAKSLIMRNFHV